jgi:hypothetical protein
VCLRTGHAGDVKAIADRDALQRLDRADRHRQAAVEALLPGDVRAETRDESKRLDLEHAAERLVGLAQPVDLGDHRTGRLRIQAAHGRGVDLGEVLQHERARRRGGMDGGDLDDVRAHVDAERREIGLAQRAAGDACGRLARGGPLEDVADVGVTVLLRADEIGVAGTWQMNLGDGLGDGPRAHAIFPVGVVTVGDVQRHGTAEGEAVAHAAGDLGAVALDLHAPAPAVAELAAGEVGAEIVMVQAQARGQALDDAGQAGAVGLAGGGEAEAHRQLAYLPVTIAARTGAGFGWVTRKPRICVRRCRRRSPQPRASERFSLTGVSAVA